MDKRLDIFLKSVTDYADAQCKKLEKTAETRMQKEITAYKKQATEQSRAASAREIGKIQSAAAGKAAEYESGKRLALSALKNELSDNLFSELTERVKAFSESADYADFLKRSANALCSVLGQDIIFYIRPQDMKYSDILNSASENAEIREDTLISLGGIAATDKAGTLRADDTLDARLSTEKKTFFENADFKVY